VGGTHGVGEMVGDGVGAAKLISSTATFFVCAGAVVDAASLTIAESLAASLSVLSGWTEAALAT
jgi:hypothetical protein